MIEVWHIWVLVGLLLMGGEMLTSGFVLVFFGVGCFAAGAGAAGDLTFKVQVLIFVITSLASLFALRRFFTREAEQNSVPSNVEAMIGKSATVEVALLDDATGRVKVGGESWQARRPAGSSGRAEVGQRVRIDAIEGATLIVSSPE